MDFTGGITFTGGMSVTAQPPLSSKAIFGYGTNGNGSSGTAVSMTNRVSTTGVVATDTTGVGTARGWLAAATYGP